MGQGPLIVFTGQMDYRPNVDAVTWFARQVLPALRRTRPDLRFAIVGRNPTPPVKALAKHAGVSRQTVYSIFGTREDLVSQAVTDQLAGVGGASATLSSPSDDGASGRAHGRRR
mgnify:CR=1 FL=1